MARCKNRTTKKHVSRKIPWAEYLERVPDGLGYCRFFDFVEIGEGKQSGLNVNLILGWRKAFHGQFSTYDPDSHVGVAYKSHRCLYQHKVQVTTHIQKLRGLSLLKNSFTLMCEHLSFLMALLNFWYSTT